MFDAIINALVGTVMVDVEIAAKLNPDATTNEVSVLGADGRSYTLYFRKKLKNGTTSNWKAIKFM